jgi:catechol 2,3-dioxygenase-like lactoylglutathione lyase family enzyme
MSALNHISPFFIVSDLDDSVSFYTDKLGFELRFMGPEEEPYFAIVGRGPVELMLKASGNPVPNHTRYSWARWDAFISAPNPDALFEEFNTAGVSFRQPLRDDDDGLRGFEITDTDGYVLFFGRPNP